ncbi:MAG: Uncharacterized protein FD148_1391 [Methylocystaceae bacterium]|nr:MAG: Uncharacterized protein FD148_1391 [Methylocystaceae bacterium]
MRQSQKPRFSLINSDSPVSQLCAASLKILRQKFQKPPESHNPRRADRGAKIRRLGRLWAPEFGSARPELRACRIMSDKRTLSDIGARRQARRIAGEF